MPDHKGWYSRGYLPHLDSPELIHLITFRLADSLPRDVLLRFDRTDPAARAKSIERYLDAGYGACHLKDPRVAQIVEDGLQWGDGERYRLLAWVIMPNHVHALIETLPGWPVPVIVQGWKGFSARQANGALRRRGRLWQPDYHDRYVRDETHYARAVAYIEQNPVKAGLVCRPEVWTFGSARRRTD